MDACWIVHALSLALLADLEERYEKRRLGGASFPSVRPAEAAGDQAHHGAGGMGDL